MSNKKRSKSNRKFQRKLTYLILFISLAMFAVFHLTKKSKRVMVNYNTNNSYPLVAVAGEPEALAEILWDLKFDSIRQRMVIHGGVTPNVVTAYKLDLKTDSEMPMERLKYKLISTLDNLDDYWEKIPDQQAIIPDRLRQKKNQSLLMTLDFKAPENSIIMIKFRYGLAPYGTIKLSTKIGGKYPVASHITKAIHDVDYYVVTIVDKQHMGAALHSEDILFIRTVNKVSPERFGQTEENYQLRDGLEEIKYTFINSVQDDKYPLRQIEHPVFGIRFNITKNEEDVGLTYSGQIIQSDYIPKKYKEKTSTQSTISIINNK